MRVAWIVYGSLDRRTGGTIYDAEVVRRLRTAGVSVEVIGLRGAPAAAIVRRLATLRPDVAGIFGPQFAAAGFLLTGATLPAGTYDLAVFAHSTVTQSFNNWRVVRIHVIEMTDKRF